MRIISFFLSVLLLISISCDRKTAGSRTTNTSTKKAETKITQLISPERNASFVSGDEIGLRLLIPDTLVADSIKLWVRGKFISFVDTSGNYTIDTDGMYPGKVTVRVKVFLPGGKSETHSHQIELLSDIVPVNYSYKVLKEYPHDVGAYTQGLLYYDGWLYEGTGQQSRSTIRKVRLENGEVIKMRNNASNIFGEGITIYKGRIYQLTYQAQICYVYDLNSFDEVQKFYYQNKEGWGLTNNGKELIMSDGTHVLYFIDPEMFTVKRQVEVYSNKGLVDSLNELEWINGKIFANRYYTDEIVIIDPDTGKLEGRINLKGILPVKERKPSTNVLNGIAYDSDSNRLFVTGKYWPKLYEIDLEVER